MHPNIVTGRSHNNKDAVAAHKRTIYNIPPPTNHTYSCIPVPRMLPPHFLSSQCTHQTLTQRLYRTHPHGTHLPCNSPLCSERRGRGRGASLPPQDSRGRSSPDARGSEACAVWEARRTKHSRHIAEQCRCTVAVQTCFKACFKAPVETIYRAQYRRATGY